MAQINHLAIVVEDIEAALGFWHEALGLPLGKVERNNGEEVDLGDLWQASACPTYLFSVLR